MNEDQIELPAHPQTSYHGKVAPVRVYQELAENGMLYDFLQDFMPDAVENDEAFRKEMYRIMLTSALAAIPGLEISMLRDLAEALIYFNTQTIQCRQQKLSAPTS